MSTQSSYIALVAAQLQYAIAAIVYYHTIPYATVYMYLDLTEATINHQYFEMGMGYIHNRDRKGNPLSVFCFVFTSGTRLIVFLCVSGSKCPNAKKGFPYIT